MRKRQVVCLSRGPSNMYMGTVSNLMWSPLLLLKNYWFSSPACWHIWMHECFCYFNQFPYYKKRAKKPHLRNLLVCFHCAIGGQSRSVTIVCYSMVTRMELDLPIFSSMVTRMLYSCYTVFWLAAAIITTAFNQSQYKILCKKHISSGKPEHSTKCAIFSSGKKIRVCHKKRKNCSSFMKLRHPHVLLKWNKSEINIE